MSETPEQKWDATVAFAEGEDVALMIALGKTVMRAMRKIENMERFAQKNGLVYTTRFPMPDDREWALTVAPHIEPTA